MRSIRKRSAISSFLWVWRDREQSTLAPKRHAIGPRLGSSLALFRSTPNSNFIELTVCRLFSDPVTYVSFLGSGSKSGAGLDDDSVNGEKSLSSPPQVHSIKPGGTVKCKFEVHVQIDGVNRIHVILIRTRCGP